LKNCGGRGGSGEKKGKGPKKRMSHTRGTEKNIFSAIVGGGRVRLTGGRVTWLESGKHGSKKLEEGDPRSKRRGIISHVLWACPENRQNQKETKTKLEGGGVGRPGMVG